MAFKLSYNQETMERTTRKRKMALKKPLSS
jgi:hypothetical protein